MNNATALATPSAAATLERVIAVGDLSKLTAEERTQYYARVCESVGLNPLTRPFEYLTLQGKTVLYARKDCTDQLRSVRGVSLSIASREQVGDVYVVTARATTPDGRADESIGAVTIGNLKGDGLANALMKAETKAKRRVTLSICGLGLLDESEIETIPRDAVERPNFNEKNRNLREADPDEQPRQHPHAEEIASLKSLARQAGYNTPKDLIAWMRANLRDGLLPVDGRTLQEWLELLPVADIEAAIEFLREEADERTAVADSAISG